MALRSDQKLLIGASVVAFLLWVTPLCWPLGVPLVFLNTHLHEFFHAIAAVATGGQALGIQVNHDGTGMTPVRGGNLLVVASAGYVGTAILGAALIYWSRTEAGAKRALVGLAVVMLLSLVLWVRGDVAGVISAIGWIIVFGIAGLFFRGKAAVFTGQFIGIQQCLTSLQAFAALFLISAMHRGDSDATILAHATGIPAILWATAWVVFSLSLMYITIRAAWRGR